MKKNPNFICNIDAFHGQIDRTADPRVKNPLVEAKGWENGN